VFRSETWAASDTFPGGQRRHFAHPFQVTYDTMLNDVLKTLHPFFQWQRDSNQRLDSSHDFLVTRTRLKWHWKRRWYKSSHVLHR